MGNKLLSVSYRYFLSQICFYFYRMSIHKQDKQMYFIYKIRVELQMQIVC